MAYDLGRDRIVLFGGHCCGTVSNPLGDTWEFDGSNWVKMQPANSPTPRASATLVYSPLRKRVLLFGGFSNVNGKIVVHNDLWEWDGSTWKKLNFIGGPSPRSSMLAMYFPPLGKVLFFGGESGGSYYSDTWTLDQNGWKLLKPGIAPPKGVDQVMEYDPITKKMILFGGHINFKLLKNDTWGFDGKTWSILKASNKPPARWKASLVRIGSCGQLALFGGAANWVPFNDLYIWDGKNWKMVPRTSVWPKPREGHAMVYDSKRKRAILFGGQLPYGTQTYNDTWVLKGKTFSFWKDLGGGSAGWNNIVPVLKGSGGNLGTNTVLGCTKAPPQAYWYLGFNLYQSPRSFAGGTWFPVPLLVWSNGPTGGSILTPGSGSFQASFFMPNSPYLKGLKVYWQGLFLDFSHTPNLCISNGLELVIQC